MTPTKIRPTISIAVMTSLPSSAAVFASGSTTTMLTHPTPVGPEGVELLGERGEDRLALALVLGTERVAPEGALGRCLRRDCLPDIRGYNQAASSFVQ